MNMRLPSLRFLRNLILMSGFLSAAWFAGLMVFVAHVKTMKEPDPVSVESADAVVVLTGGSERVDAGFQLLAAGKGKKLFISGVHPGLTLDHMQLGSFAPDKDLRACCVELGHEAGSTMGNAEETRVWMRREGYHSLRLVTANYHMLRSEIIFRAALPDIDIATYPVSPNTVRLDEWWARPGTASLLVTEYNKYLMA
ncbi:MAG: YdcF family protein, partial [Bdellovibrionales bacterium]